MSLTKEALQLVNDNALAAAGKSLPTNTPTALVPESVQIVSLENFQAGRSRFRGTYTTDSLADFGGYVVDRGHALAKGFVDQKAMACKVFFNLGDEKAPGHADDTAVLKLSATAAYQAVTSIGGRAMSQKDLSDWIEDWSLNLKVFDQAGEEVKLAKAIAGVRNITVKGTSESDHSVGETSSRRSAMEQIEASSKDTIPANLVFTTVPYEGLSPRDFTFRLSVITSGSQPVMKLRWIGEEIQREEVAQEFKGAVMLLVNNNAKLRIGSFDVRS